MAPQYEGEIDGKISGQNLLNGLQMVQFEASSIEVHLSHPILELGEFHFPIIGPLG